MATPREAKEKTTHVAALSLLSLLLLAATPLAPSSADHTADTEGSEGVGAKTHSQGAELATPANALSADHPTTAGNHETQNYYCYGSSSDGTALAWTTALAALAVALFTLGLWWTSRKQWHAISDTNRISRSNQHRAYRPWVFTDMMEIGIIESGSPVEIKFRLVNHGATPALRVRLTVGWRTMPVGPDQFKIEPDYPTERTKPYTSAVIPPNGGFMRIEDGLPLTEDDKFEMAFQALRLCIYGKIEYRGTFKSSNATPYSTTFCYFHHLGTNAFWLLGPYNEAT